MASPSNHLDPVGIINVSIIAINALLQVINNLKGQAGLTDEQIAARFAEHGAATQAFIADLLAKLPSTS